MVMIDPVLPAATTLLGAWVRERLREEPIAWLTTVDADGIAQPPIRSGSCGTASRSWFITARMRGGSSTSGLGQVTFHLDSHGRDGDGVVLIGVAEIVPDEPRADQQSAFVDKYRDRMEGGPQRWAQSFPVPLRIHLTRFRGFHMAGPGRQGVT
jgi:hypothetical protein